MPEVFAPFSTVSAIAPGVLGTTGMESAELLAAAVRQIQPDAVIAVDAVASCEPERLCAAVQLSTAGITPGSGVGNARAAIDRTTLGVPVLAIGVPTVMDLGGRRMKDGTIPATAHCTGNPYFSSARSRVNGYGWRWGCPSGPCRPAHC